MRAITNIISPDYFVCGFKKVLRFSYVLNHLGMSIVVAQKILLLEFLYFYEILRLWYRIIRLIDNDLLFPCRESFRFLTCSSQPISWKMANKQNGRININLIRAILLLHFLEEESNVTLNFLFHLFYHSDITHRIVHLTIINRHRIFDGLLP